MACVIQNTDWILQDVDGTTYNGYQHAVKKGVFMITTDNGRGATRYLIGNQNYVQQWTNRANLEYDYYQRFISDVGRLVNLDGKAI